jgi:hypothetical protein
LVGRVHGATTGGYGFWVLTAIDLLFIFLTLKSGKFYPPFRSPDRPIDRRRQPLLFLLIVSLFFAVMAVLIVLAIRADRSSPISW